MPTKLTKIALKNILKGSATNNNEQSIGVGSEFNSKEIKPGQIFFAIRGAKTHGHNFLKDAFLQGAALAVVESSDFLKDPEVADRVIVVEDSLKGMQTLATHLRSQFQGTVIGVAGSVGKTTTKDLIGNMTSQLLHCTWSKKSFNNLLGLSYTICNANLDDRLWILELGMNHEGELAELSKIARPDVAIITKIAPEHMEFFRDLNHVADAEFEILAGLNDSGTLLLNGDDTMARSAYARNAKKWNKARLNLKYFGLANSDMAVSNFAHKIESSLKATFDLKLGSDVATITTDIIGKHNAGNFAAAILAIKVACPDIPLSEIQKTISSIPPSPMRLNQFILKNGTLVIDDSYNSSPDAVLAAIEILKEIKNSGRSVSLVLGDMFELGEKATEFHKDLVEPITELKPNYVITFGSLMALLSDQLKMRGIKNMHASSVEEIADLAINNHSDVILFKASRGVGLDKAVKLTLQ